MRISVLMGSSGNSFTLPGRVSRSRYAFFIIRETFSAFSDFVRCNKCEALELRPAGTAQSATRGVIRVPSPRVWPTSTHM
jgi:hypothetical protein